MGSKGWWGDGHHHSDGVQISALHTNTYVDNVRIYNNVIGGDIGSFSMRYCTGG